MVPFIAASGLPFVVMHWRGHSADMQTRAHYDDVVNDVRRELADRIAAIVDAGVDVNQLIVDPGIGFAKRPEADDNWALLAAPRSGARPRTSGAHRCIAQGISRALAGVRR